MSEERKHIRPGKEDLLWRMKDAPLEQRLYVAPLISERQVGEGTIDMRCGTEFIIVRRTRRSIVDPLAPRGMIGDYQEKTYVEPGHFLFLHPRQFILGCTLEYVRMPGDLCAFVVGRSSWGREGLMIATATFVHPTYAGVITLELVNVGEAPISLYPGSRIAQLAFESATPSKRHFLKSKYIGSTGPTFSRLDEDDEWPLIKKLQGPHE
jgi:dCTP deaminase